MTKLAIKFWFTVIVSLVCVNLSLHKPVSAAKESLTISPLRNQINISPGQKYNGSLKIKNSGDKALNIEVYASSFAVTNEAYDQEFNQPNNPLATNNWFHFKQTKYNLAPHTTQTVEYEIIAPKEAEPGGHYAAIFTQTQQLQSNSNDVVEIKRAASLVYIEVAGQVSRAGSIASLDARHWYKSPPISIKLRIKNSGNTHYRVDGYLTLKNTLGKEVSNKRINGLLMPNTTRAFDSIINTPKWPGIYKLEAKIGFPDGKVDTTSTTLIYLPVIFIVIICVLTLIMCIVLVRFINKKKRSKTNRSVEPPYKE